MRAGPALAFGVVGLAVGVAVTSLVLGTRPLRAADAAATPTVADTGSARARDLRYEGFRSSMLRKWTESLQLFDDAAKVDANGDKDPAVGIARARAHRNLVEAGVAP